MERIFSSISNDFKLDLLNSSEKYNLPAYLFRYVPLRSLSNQEYLLPETVEDLIAAIDEQIQGKNIDELVDLTLQLGEDYWKLNKTASFSEIRMAFQNNIVTGSDEELENILRNDLRDWMQLSLFYTAVFLSDKYFKKGEIALFCYPSDSDKRKLEQHFYQFYKCKPLFLSAFFGTFKKGCQLPTSSTGKSPPTIETTNLLDWEIITKIISSKDPSKNSFIFSNEQLKSTPMDPLRIFSDLTLSPNCPSDFLSNILKEKTSKNDQGKWSNIAEGFDVKICVIYNQFLLEKISNMNFLSALAGLFLEARSGIAMSSLANAIYLSILMRMATSPLVRFRLHFLKVISECSSFSSAIPQNSSVLIERFISYHLRCTVPLMDALFHYIVGRKLFKLSKQDKNIYLGKKRKEYCHSLFEREPSKNPFNLYSPITDRYTKKNIPTPTINPKCYFDMNKPHACSIQHDLYKSLFENTVSMACNNLFSTLTRKEIQKNQIKGFQEALGLLSPNQRFM